MKERFHLGGYAFDTKAEWEEAKKEEEAIGYIKAKTNLSDPAAILKIYTGLVEKKTFITPVGIDFLRELKRSILLSGTAKEDSLPGIPVRLSAKKSRRVEEFSKEAGDRQKMMVDYYKGKLKNTQVAVAVLILVIAAMFAITLFGPGSPLLDAEVQIQDKYASWEQELTQREGEARQKEQELAQREEKIRQKEQELGIAALAE